MFKLLSLDSSGDDDERFDKGRNGDESTEHVDEISVGGIPGDERDDDQDADEEDENDVEEEEEEE